MLTTELQTAAYIAAAVLFILSLGGLSNQESAKRAVWYGIVGMFIAVFATILGPNVNIGPLLVIMLVAGAAIGVVVAGRVEMTGMPELVAALHSFVGLAAVFIGINSDINPPELASNAEKIIHEVEVFIGVFIGAITFTGSIIAYGKLSGKLDGKALILPARHLLNILLLLASVALLFMYMNHMGSWTLYLMTLLAFILGAHLVLAIGGADMPVVVSMLNSYSGWAAAATGLQKPSSAARALAAGAKNIERVDKVVKTLAGIKGMQHQEVDAIVKRVDGWLQKNNEPQPA